MLIVGLWFWLSTCNQETTDDAYTEGDAVTVAPKISGYVVKLLVKDNKRAQLGLAQAQLSLSRVQYPAQLAQAKAQQARAEANLQNAEAQVEVAAQVQLQVCQAETNVEARKRQVDQAQAPLETAELNLSYSDVRVAIRRFRYPAQRSARHLGTGGQFAFLHGIAGHLDYRQFQGVSA